MLTVYQFAHSPYCIPITRALEAFGAEFDTVEVDPGTKEEVIRLTEGRYYHVPVLRRGGEIVCESGGDSQDVARWVDREYCGGWLFPAELEGYQMLAVPYLENDVEVVGFRLADIHYVPAIADPLTRALVVRHKERKFGPGCVDRWRAEADELRAELGRLLAPFEKMLESRPFLFGEAPVYSDFLLYGVLGNATYKGWNSIPANCPRVRAHFARIEAFAC